MEAIQRDECNRAGSRGVQNWWREARRTPATQLLVNGRLVADTNLRPGGQGCWCAGDSGCHSCIAPLVQELTRLDFQRIGKPADSFHLGRRPALEASNSGAVDTALVGQFGLSHCSFDAPVQQAGDSSNGRARHLPGDGIAGTGVALLWTCCCARFAGLMARL